MNKVMLKVLVWLGCTVLMMVFWGIGLAIGFAIFPDSLPDSSTSDGSGGLMLVISSGLNSGAILFFIYNSQYRGWKMVGSLIFMSFGIQYFMSQIETLWFNESLDMPLALIFAVVIAGAIMYLLFSVTATWLTGKFKKANQRPAKLSIQGWNPLIQRVLILIVVVWPLIYFLAGYFIAWQFEDVRSYYSEIMESVSFSSTMIGNFTSGLYFFQILRGLLWILLASPVLMMMNVPLIRKGVILGLLFSFLGSSQLLLPNPIMPESVRMAHLLETSTSIFAWGFILVMYLGSMFKWNSKFINEAL